MANRTVKPGQTAPESRIYRCNKCHNAKAMLEGETTPVCEICLLKNRKQLWQATPHELLVKTKDVKKKFERSRGRVEKMADKITGFTGNLWFVYTHVAWFAIWIAYNMVSPVPFDPFPFGFLVLIVSLEAIVLATFILLSQHREGMISDMRAELDYQINIQAEKKIEEILALIRDMNKGKKRRR